MGWTNSHLYEFRIGGTGWGESDPDGFYDGPLEAKKGRLAAILADAGRKTFSYLYDLGDSWSHTVKLEKIAPAVGGVQYPADRRRRPLPARGLRRDARL